MVKTRSQDGDSKGKELDVEDPMESRLSRLEDMFAERSKVMTEQKAMMKQLADMVEVMRRSAATKVVEEQSTLDRNTPSSSKLKEIRSESFEHSRDERRSENDQVSVEIHQAYGSLARLGKIEFPRFDGTNLKGWLFKVEEFFGLDFTPEHLKVKMAVIHFDGQASTWNQCLIQSEVGLEVLNDWKGYVKLLRKRFEDDCDDDQPPNGEFGESIEHCMVNLVSEAQEENPKLENREGWEQIVTLEVEIDAERGQKRLSMEKVCCTHKVFAKMSQHEESLGMKKKQKGLKSWRFKFKQRVAPRDSKSGSKWSGYGNQWKGILGSRPVTEMVVLHTNKQCRLSLQAIRVWDPGGSNSETD